MKKYDFDINYLRNMRNNLQAKLNENNNNNNNNNDLKESIASYNSLLEFYDKRCTKLENSPTTKIDLLDFLNNFVANINPTKILLTSNAGLIAKKYYKIEDTDIEIIPQQLYINNQDLVDFASYIFKQTKVPYLYQEFNKIIDSNKRQLLIKSANKVNLGSIYGFTVFDTINHIPYAIVSRYNNIYDIFTLVHECMHMIINKNVSIKNNQASMYDEVEGFFIEFITSNIIKTLHPTINQESISSLEKMKLKNIINEIVYVVVFDEVIHNINAKGKINLTHINNNLMIRGFDDLDINDGNDILDYMNMDTIKAIDQISSFLIALDLYHLYLIDPEKAIYNLTTLPKLTEENIIKDLSNLDVTFYQDGYHNLNKTCKKLLKSYSQE